MELRRLLTYVVVLAVLAFALGSLPRGTSGGSVLFGSYWLLYLVYLEPVIVLAAMGALIIIIALNWRELGTGIGFGLANRRKRGKRRSRWSFIIAALFWALAIGVLITKKGSIFNPISSNSTVLKQIVGENPAVANPLQNGIAPQIISGFVQNSWFTILFLGLLIASGLVVFQAIKTSMQETSRVAPDDLVLKREAGLDAVNYAIKLIETPVRDARSRIIASYQHLIETVSKLGVPVPSDLTARELENAIRKTFSLQGQATGDLTKLFEEARYSLHDILDEHADRARTCLETIAAELEIDLDTGT